VIARTLKRLWRGHLISKGLDMAPGSMDFPQFGSEPYLVRIGKHVTISSTASLMKHAGGTWVLRHWPEYRNVIKRRLASVEVIPTRGHR